MQNIAIDAVDGARITPLFRANKPTANVGFFTSRSDKNVVRRYELQVSGNTGQLRLIELKAAAPKFDQITDLAELQDIPEEADDADAAT